MSEDLESFLSVRASKCSAQASETAKLLTGQSGGADRRNMSYGWREVEMEVQSNKSDLPRCLDFGEI